MHFASFERFADEIDASILEYEGAKYFANILMPYSGFILKVLDKVKASNNELPRSELRGITDCQTKPSRNES